MDLLSLIICLVGMVLYVLPVDSKISTIGLHMFWVGLLVFLAKYSGVVLR